MAPIHRALIYRALIPRASNSIALTSSIAGLTIVRFSRMNKAMDITNIVITLFLINVVIYITPLNIRSITSIVIHTAINIVTLNTATPNTSNPIHPVAVIN